MEEEEESLKECIKNSNNLKKLGKGSFGFVFKLEYKGKEYAIKKIPKSKIDYVSDIELREYMISALENEIEILKKMSEFENSVKFFYYFKEEKEHIIVLEFCDSDLKKLLDEKKKLSSLEILTIMEELNKPLKYMHENKIIHRDIKPENIMIKYVDSSKKKYIPKIADYGLSKILDEGKTSTNVGSRDYKAPEITDRNQHGYNDKADLYSIGVMMYQLYFNSFPFMMFKKGPKKKKDCEDKDLDDLLNKLLIFDPEKRISWEDYFAHPFFNHNKGVEDLKKKVENLKIYNEKEHQKIDFCDRYLENIIKENYIEKETIKNIPPQKLISIDECLNLKNEPFFILGILGKYLESIGISVVIEKDEISRDFQLKNYHKNIMQIICNSYICKNKYLLDFEFDEMVKYSFDNPVEKRNFNEKIKNIIMEMYNLKEAEIFVTSIVRDKKKFTVVIIIKSNFNPNITKEELIKKFEEKYQELKALVSVEKELIIPTIKLNTSMLEPKEDNKRNKWGKKPKGGEVYFPPIDWIKYGIKIDHNFGEKNKNWISFFHKESEWCAAYCGITGINKKIEQIYENDDDIRHQGEKVGIGVYCPCDPKIMEEYTETINANGENYKVGFMIRVKPNKFRASKKNKNIWVVNGNDDEFRPYGILIKEIKKSYD